MSAQLLCIDDCCRVLQHPSKEYQQQNLDASLELTCGNYATSVNSTSTFPVPGRVVLKTTEIQNPERVNTRDVTSLFNMLIW